MGPKKTLERIKYSFFWEGLRADVKKFYLSCKECQLTRSVRIKDRSSSTPVARPELPFEVGNMDLIGPIDSPSLKGHKYILCLVDQHTRWGEAVPLTSLSAKVTCEAWLNIFSRTEIYLLSKREGFVEKNSAASWVTVLDLWKRYFGRSLTKGGACKEPLPAPGNRSNERRYKEKDLARTEKKLGTGEERVAKKAGVVKSRHGWTIGVSRHKANRDQPEGLGGSHLVLDSASVSKVPKSLKMSLETCDYRQLGLSKLNLHFSGSSTAPASNSSISIRVQFNTNEIALLEKLPKKRFEETQFNLTLDMLYFALSWNRGS
ncbi:retrovirus-related Pol polyprotein from transposon opus [Trichonephila clavipes]|uniref:RNA-directed DNA polymerase n=1 Tax=Trichonephila clavipes TaxID=2585209 RepID=A0A8X6RSA2_TRICX|nr:retrovirus-related Pol polyprotein from transposon opus [Trichonephila clavipes]